LSCSDMNELAPTYTPAVWNVRVFPLYRGNSRLHCRFWPEPVSVFGSLVVTVPVSSSLMLGISSSLSPDRIDACSRGSRLTAVSSSRGWDNVVSVASDPTVTSRASTDRLLRTEPQVRLMSFSISNNHCNLTFSRTDEPTIARMMPRKFKRRESFSATNPSQLEGKIAYVQQNTPTACPPRTAVPVNTRACFGESLSTQHARFAFDQGCDFF
jgi:hypothetical protein